jgi:oxygen-independent coproporphyrinogen-3 oxidase
VVPTSVYVHFPWCLKKCPYCDFSSFRTEREAVPHAAYADAVVRELLARPVPGRRLVSVFFGGGTPSLWEPAALGRVLAAIRGAFAAEAQDLEITVECNPTSLDRARAAALRGVGVNRLSVGIQSLSDERLRFLGRLHDAKLALASLEAAVAEMPRVSGDLIFGVAGQTPEEAASEVRRVLDTGVEHVSAYALTIEHGTQFGELHQKGRLPLAPEDDVADAYLAVERTLESAGFSHYEVSNYARPGAEARHNVHYWRGGDYLGVGAGAVGCLATPDGAALRWRDEPLPDRYVARAGSSDLEVEHETLGAEERARERLMLGLRTREGVDLDDLARELGLDVAERRRAAIERRVARGELVLSGARLCVPPSHWLGLDAIVLDLF